MRRSEDVALVVEAAAVKAGVERLRVLLPGFRRPEIQERRHGSLTELRAPPTSPPWNPPELHLLVGEHSCYSSVCSGEHGQESIPEHRGWREKPPECDSAREWVPDGEGRAHVFRSLFFHTLSTSCWMIPVSRIRLCRRRLSPDGRNTHQRINSHFQQIAHDDASS